jgi:hypothetical protein
MKDGGRSETIQETFRIARGDTSKRTKQIFQEYPSAMYLTEIVSSKTLGSGGVVEMTVRRLRSPIATDD